MKRLGKRIQSLEAAVKPRQGFDGWRGLVPDALRKLSRADQELLRSDWCQVRKEHPDVWERLDAALLEASEEGGYVRLRAVELLL